MDKVQSCQTEDTCSQQEPCLWTAKSFVTVPREAMIFPSGITSTNLATVFKYLLPYKIHIGIKAGDAQMQKGRRPLQITSALCHTSFWNSFSLETGSWQISSLISDTRSVRGKVTSPVQGVYNLFHRWQNKLNMSPFPLLSCSNFLHSYWARGG